MAALAITSCASKATDQAAADDFDYTVDRFADIEVLRYKVPGFEELSLNQKQLIYYLNEAALWGRDILWDQNCKYNLPIRYMLEDVYNNYSGDRETDKEYKAFETYLKQVWFANGIHHHYSTDKFVPEFSREFLEGELAKLPADARWRSMQDELLEVIFNPEIYAKRVNQAEGQDLILTSANNMYEGVTQKEVEDFYAAMKNPADTTPVSYGLNARVTKDANGNVVEQVYRLGGYYNDAIAHIVENLEKAMQFAENEVQRNTIAKLIEYYRSGDLRTFDDYSITWVTDTASQVDFINGFIESYGDPLGMTGSWESIVNFKNIPASHRTEVLSSEAQWFENNSPVDPRFRKDSVKVSAPRLLQPPFWQATLIRRPPLASICPTPTGFAPHTAPNR